MSRLNVRFLSLRVPSMVEKHRRRRSRKAGINVCVIVKVDVAHPANSRYLGRKGNANKDSKDCSPHFLLSIFFPFFPSRRWNQTVSSSMTQRRTSEARSKSRRKWFRMWCFVVALYFQLFPFFYRQFMLKRHHAPLFISLTEKQRARPTVR